MNDPTAISNSTAMYLAAIQGNEDIGIALAEAGADPTTVSNYMP